MARLRRTVFTAGCFNRVHKAHLKMLRKARSLGDELTVVLANDAHNHKSHAVPARTRLGWLRKTGLAERVRIGGKDGFARSLIREKPAVLALGYDQKIPDEETALAIKALGVRVVRLPWFSGKEKAIFFKP